MGEERKRILEMVQEGKLTADEALILLEKLERNQTENQALSTHVKETNQKSGHQSFKQGSIKDKFSEFIGSTIQKIRDADLDFNFGPSIEMNHIFQHKDVYLSSIEVDIANGEIILVPWNEQDVRIECNAKVYKVSDQEAARKVFQHGVYFSVNGEKMTFSVQKKQIKVKTTIYIPEENYKEISCRMFNGSISGDKISVTKLYAKTANGNITLNHMESHKIETETAIGKIQIAESNAKEIEAETLNGIISVSGKFKKMDLQSFNGSLICKNHAEDTSSILLKSKAGNIDLFIPKEVEVDGKLKSNIGGFVCELENMSILDEKKEVVNKEFHFVANKDKGNTIYVDAETNAGSILIKHNH